MKRWLKWAAAIVAALLVAMIWVPVPLRLDIAMPAVEVRHGDATVAIPRTVRVQGRYHFYLYKADVFEGTKVRISCEIP